MVTANGDVREVTAVNRNQHVQLTNEAYRPAHQADQAGLVHAAGTRHVDSAERGRVLTSAAV